MVERETYWSSRPGQATQLTKSPLLIVNNRREAVKHSRIDRSRHQHTCIQIPHLVIVAAVPNSTRIHRAISWRSSAAATPKLLRLSSQKESTIAE